VVLALASALQVLSLKVMASMLLMQTYVLTAELALTLVLQALSLQANNCLHTAKNKGLCQTIWHSPFVFLCTTHTIITPISRYKYD
jgi:hypothetical protein